MKWLGRGVRVLGAETRGVAYHVEWDEAWNTYRIFFKSNGEELSRLDYHLIRT